MIFFHICHPHKQILLFVIASIREYDFTAALNYEECLLQIDMKEAINLKKGLTFLRKEFVDNVGPNDDHLKGPELR